eukprot:scaffold912_cov119-Cylindrotheca_fusiformis.AAC.9
MNESSPQTSLSSPTMVSDPFDYLTDGHAHRQRAMASPVSRNKKEQGQGPTRTTFFGSIPH